MYVDNENTDRGRDIAYGLMREKGNYEPSKRPSRTLTLYKPPSHHGKIQNRYATLLTNTLLPFGNVCLMSQRSCQVPQILRQQL